MPVIKHANSDAAVRSAIVLDLGDLRRQGEVLIERARAEAERIIAEAQEEATALIAGADAKGFAQGEARGLESGHRDGAEAGRREATEALRAQFQGLAASWTAGLAAWEDERDAMLRGAREDVLALAIALARKIVLRTPIVDPTVVQDQLAAALELMNTPSALSIRVHPEDEALLQDVLPELLDALAACGHAEIDADEGMARGGCIVSAGRGVVDATLEAQLDRIADLLLPEPPEVADDAEEPAP
jgi:flagellar biosynthesis/type III secretory pathway protein FliH